MILNILGKRKREVEPVHPSSLARPHAAYVYEYVTGTIFATCASVAFLLKIIVELSHCRAIDKDPSFGTSVARRRLLTMKYFAACAILAAAAFQDAEAFSVVGKMKKTFSKTTPSVGMPSLEMGSDGTCRVQER